MNIYEKELSGTDEIFNEVKSIVENGNIGDKIEIARMFSSAKREYDQNKIIDALREKAGNEKIIYDVIIIDDESGIVIRKAKLISDDVEKLYYQPVHLRYGNYTWFNLLDEALIGLVCMKHNSDCVKWISRMVGIGIE